MTGPCAETGDLDGSAALYPADFAE